MRFLRVLLPAFVIAGCAATPAEDSESSSDSLVGKKDDSVAYGPCAASRATILGTVSAARAAAISRGFEWLDADVPFSMSATHETYRTDCSGFVSMCWSLKAPGLNTKTLGTAGSGSYKLGSYDELVPADALVDPGHHSMIFLGWNDSNRTGACVLEQSSTKNDMQFRVRLTATLKGDGFIPVRSDEFANDTTVTKPKEDGTSNGTAPGEISPGGGDSTDLGGGVSEKPPADPSTDDKFDTTPVPVCKSKSVSVVCGEAYATGIQCGRVIDNCGRAVDCNGLAGFGCSANETCSNKKCTSTCYPKRTEDICYSAQLKDGVECGKVPDGCGGTVDCDGLAYFGCKDGEKCGETKANRCPSSKTDTSDPSKPETKPSDDDRLTPGDPGDDDDQVAPSSTRTPDSDDAEADAPPAKKKKAASTGCSTVPGSSSSSGLGGAALGLALVIAARRRRSA